MASTLIAAPVAAALVAHDPSARPDRATLLGEGWGSVAWCVPAAGDDWVVRLPRPRSPWAPGDLEREVRLLPLLERRPFEIAVPRQACLLRDEEGRTLAALHRLVPGTPVTQRSLPRGRARGALLADIGRALSVLHATPVQEARRHGAREIDLWSEHYFARIERALPLLPPAARAWLAGRAAEFGERGGTTQAPRVLIHADVSGDHLLVNEEGRLSGMIDFADARIADPALDFAGILNTFRWNDLRHVLEHYSGPVDAGLLDRSRFYIQVAPIYQVLDGATAVGPEEMRRGIRRLAARAAAAARTPR